MPSVGKSILCYFGLTVGRLLIGAPAVAVAGPIPEGPSRFVLPNQGEPITIFCYKPPTYSSGPILVVIHGSDRNAEDYRNDAISVAERCEMLVVAPLFDRKRFDDERYKRGCGVTKGGRPQPREQWSFNIIVRLVAEVRAREGSPLPYYVLGHSGGGQFVAKMAMFMPDEAVRLVAANPGSNVFPDRTAAFPYGLGGLPEELSNDDALRRYCAAPLTLYLGTGDIYQNASDGFDFSPAAMRQGPVRLARNHNFFETMRRLAAAHHWPFHWRLVETPDIGHSGAKMFHAPEVEDALFGNK
jgi:pimeloyl-ACP methyl ester carboxylesterase